MVKQIKKIEPASPNWEDGRAYKDAMRNIIAMDAYNDGNPVSMLSLPGELMLTELRMHQQGVRFKESLGFEYKPDVMLNIKKNMARLPEELRTVMTIKSGNIIAKLREMESAQTPAFGIYWLDFMGPITKSTLDAIESIAKTRGLKEAIQNHTQIRIYITIQANDQWKRRNTVIAEELATRNKRLQHLNPEVPQINKPQSQEQRMLEHYYNEAAQLHHHIAGIFKFKGYATTNNHAIFYRDTETTMLFLSEEITFESNYESESPPIEPIFLGMGKPNETPRSTEWVENMIKAGLLDPLSSKEKVKEAKKQGVINALIQLGEPELAQRAKEYVASKSKVVVKPNPNGLVTDPVVYKTVSYLKNKSSVTQQSLIDHLRKKLPNGETLCKKPPGQKTRPLINHIAHAKKSLGEGGYAIPGTKGGIKLTPKGIKLCKNVPKYTIGFSTLLSKGML